MTDRLVRHWCELALNNRQLFRGRLVQRLPRQVLHGKLPDHSGGNCGVFRTWSSRASRDEAPDRIADLFQFMVGIIEMVAIDDHFLWRVISSRLTGSPLTSLLGRHVLGCNIQGGREQQLLY